MPDFAGATPIGAKDAPQKETPLEEEAPETNVIEVPENIFPEAENIFIALAQKRMANGELLKQIQMHGVGLDPASLIQTRLSALIDTLFDGTTVEGQIGMLTVEHNFETAMADVLKEAAANVVKAVLSQGANVSPDEMQRMAQAAGIGVPAALRRKGG